MIESMTIAAYAADCRDGHIYLRGEYPNAREILAHALSVAGQHGYLGTEIYGEAFDFDIEIRQGAGAYICREETAIFNSIEGYRGEPRAKPPFPTERGLFGKPTVVNNVETLLNVPWIVLNGGLKRAQAPRSRPARACSACPGTRPGRAYTRCRSLGKLGALLERAGGIAEGRELQAVLLGGAGAAAVREDPRRRRSRRRETATSDFRL